MLPTFGLERELENHFQIIEYENGNGDFHFHSHIEICIVNSGKINALINKKTKILKKDEMAVALSYDTHLYSPLEDSKFTVLIIPVHLCEKFISPIQCKKNSNPFICDKLLTNKITSYLEELKKEKNNDLKIIGYIYLILGIVMENLCLESPNDATETKLISKILIYIHNNYNKNITLQSIAAVFGYHPNYISKYFKLNLNIGLIRYINILRLKNAIKLMLTKQYNITQCALESGFSTLRTFYRVFNEEFSCSPKEYMKKSQKL